MIKNIEEYLNKRFTKSTTLLITSDQTSSKTKYKTIKRKSTKPKKIDKNKPDENLKEEEEEEEDSKLELEKLDNLSQLDTQELINEENKIQEKKGEEKNKKDINIVFRDYDETNKTGIKFKHKEYVKKGYYLKDESAQFVKGSKEYYPNIQSNHSNLNKFIKRIQMQAPVEKGVKTGYKYRKERLHDSGYEFRDEVGKFYKQNMLKEGDPKDYDVGFRFQDTITNNSFGKQKAIFMKRDGIQFKHGFGVNEDYENKYKHDYENYADSRSEYKRKKEAHHLEKQNEKFNQNQIVKYNVLNEQFNYKERNIDQVNVDHFDYGKIEKGNKIRKRKYKQHQIPPELNNGFEYMNNKFEETDANKTYRFNEKSGKMRFLNNGSSEIMNENKQERRLKENGIMKGLNYTNDKILPLRQNINLNRNGTSFLNVNETGFIIKDEIMNNPFRNYKYNKSIGRLFSKLSNNDSYKDVIFENIDTRYRNEEEGYRKIDRQGHVFVKENIQNISKENKKEYNIVHEKLVQPNFKMINEKGMIRANIESEYADYYDKMFTHYLKQYKNNHIKYTQKYDHIVHMKKQILNNTKLNISYYKLMQKSHDRILYRPNNETWSIPWQDDGYTMPPEMNYIPLLGAMEKPHVENIKTETVKHLTTVLTVENLLRLRYNRSRRKRTEVYNKKIPKTTTEDPYYLESTETNYLYQSGNESDFNFLGFKFKNLSDFKKSEGKTYEESSELFETPDPAYIDSRGQYIYSYSEETTSSYQPSPFEEFTTPFYVVNGTRENRQFKYMDGKFPEDTDELTTTHHCQMNFDPVVKKMKFCDHPSHRIVCKYCNKSFKGWYEYNLHKQAINRKAQRFFFEKDGYMKDVLGYKFVNGSPFNNDENFVQIQYDKTVYLSNKHKTTKMILYNHLPAEHFNPIHHFNTHPVLDNINLDKEPSDSLLMQAADLMRSTSEEITRPDFKLLYGRNDTSRLNDMPLAKYSDITEEDSDKISLMNLAEAEMYKYENY